MNYSQARSPTGKAKRDINGKGRTFALFAQAQKKGLTVRKNVFSLGYCIVLPGGEAVPVQSIEDLRNFVKDY